MVKVKLFNGFQKMILNTKKPNSEKTTASNNQYLSLINKKFFCDSYTNDGYIYLENPTILNELELLGDTVRIEKVKLSGNNILNIDSRNLKVLDSHISNQSLFKSLKDLQVYYSNIDCIINFIDPKSTIFLENSTIDFSRITYPTKIILTYMGTCTIKNIKPNDNIEVIPYNDKSVLIKNKAYVKKR